MKEDLRYLSRLINHKNHLLIHPSDKKMADFIDAKMTKEEREEMFSHLVECKQCSDIVAKTEPYVKPKVNFNYRTHMIITALVASLAFLWFVPWQEEGHLGKINLRIAMYDSDYKSANAKIDKDKDKEIDADDAIEEILMQTSMKHILAYQKARALEEKAYYAKAREEYKQASLIIMQEKNTSKRLRQKIIIHYRLMELGYKEEKENKQSIKEYKDILHYDIAIYLLYYK